MDRDRDRDAVNDLLDDLDPQGAERRGGRTWRVYGSMPAGDRILWLHRLEKHGPLHDFRYHNDDPLTEQIRALYNELVTDPALRSEPEEIALDDLSGYGRDWDGWDERF